jgi:phenylacetate-CoA ligase
MLNLDFMPAFELTRNNARQYLDILIKTPGTFVLGYVSAVYELANHALDLNVNDIRLGGAFVTAEQLPSEWAAVIAKAFNCEAKAFYGCGEINSLGFQLKQDGPYRIPDFNANIETVEMGSITDALAITSLHNYGKPLIRYVNGDTGIVKPASLESGGFSTIEKLHGRSADFFKRANGEIVSPIIGTYSIQFTRIPVKKWQYVQKTVKDIEFRYQLLNEELTPAERQSIVDIFTRHLDSDVNIHFINTSDFILTPNGKHRLVVIQC